MKDIPGFEGRYAVTEDGRVWSYPKRGNPHGRWLRPMQNIHGYLIVELSLGNGKRTERYPKQVHRLVAEAYIPNPQNLPQVNHMDSNRANPSVENLEWVTAKGNAKHALRSGRIRLGSARKNTKLTESEVLEIRSKYLFWKYTADTLAKEYGVSPNCIHAVTTRRNWKHV